MATHSNGHNIKFAQPLIDELLKKLSDEWFNSSYHNDLAASVCIEYKKEEYLYIYIPNGTIDNFDNEEYDKFNVSDETDIIQSCKTIDEVISYVNNYLKEVK